MIKVQNRSTIQNPIVAETVKENSEKNDVAIEEMK